MGNRGDIAIKAPESGVATVDRSDLELSPILEGPLPVGGQNVDR